MLMFNTVTCTCKKHTATIFTTLCLGVMSVPPVFAYSCEAEFAKANTLILEAQSYITENSDARALAMIKEAKGIADAGIISHNNASEGHTGEVGKFMHSDAVRKGKWAQDLAKQAIFILTGEIKG